MTSCIAAVSSRAPSPSGPLIANVRYSLLRGRPSSNTTIEAIWNVPCVVEMS